LKPQPGSFLRSDPGGGTPRPRTPRALWVRPKARNLFQARTPRVLKRSLDGEAGVSHPTVSSHQPFGIPGLDPWDIFQKALGPPSMPATTPLPLYPRHHPLGLFSSFLVRISLSFSEFHVFFLRYRLFFSRLIVLALWER